ncbi:MAG: TetR/AcrR family transcriptional regulator [Mycobacteriaceae bacterium]
MAADDRQSERRSRVLEAGTELLGTGGGTAVTVRAVCRTAGVSERYFYESFASRDELVGAVFDTLARELAECTHAEVSAADAEIAVRARTFIASAVDFFAADTRRGRVLVREAMTEPALSERGLLAAPALLGSLVSDVVGRRLDDTSRSLTGAVLGLGIGALIVAWIDGQVAVERGVLIDHCARLIERSVDSAPDAGKDISPHG